jgi:hypothetical protein
MCLTCILWIQIIFPLGHNQIVSFLNACQFFVFLCTSFRFFCSLVFYCISPLFCLFLYRPSFLTSFSPLFCLCFFLAHVSFNSTLPQLAWDSTRLDCCWCFLNACVSHAFFGSKSSFHFAWFLWRHLSGRRPMEVRCLLALKSVVRRRW